MPYRAPGPVEQKVPRRARWDLRPFASPVRLSHSWGVEPLLVAREVRKLYRSTGGAVVALDSINLEVDARRARRRDGAVGLRQDHDAQLPLRSRRHRQRPRLRRRPRPVRDERRRTDHAPGSRDGLHLPGVQPDPRVQRGRERRAAAAAAGDVAEGGSTAAPWRCSTGSGSATERPTSPTRCRAASSNGSRSPARLSADPRSCGPTSPPATSTARWPTRSCSSSVQLNEEEQQTIVLVTHDSGIGAAAGRVVRMRDGRLESDERRDGHAHRPDHDGIAMYPELTPVLLVLLALALGVDAGPRRREPGAAPPRVPSDRPAADRGRPHHQRFDPRDRPHREQPLGRRLARHVDQAGGGPLARTDRRTDHHRRSRARRSDRRPARGVEVGSERRRRPHRAKHRRGDHVLARRRAEGGADHPALGPRLRGGRSLRWVRVGPVRSGTGPGRGRRSTTSSRAGFRRGRETRSRSSSSASSHRCASPVSCLATAWPAPGSEQSSTPTRSSPLERSSDSPLRPAPTAHPLTTTLISNRGGVEAEPLLSDEVEARIDELLTPGGPHDGRRGGEARRARCGRGDVGRDGIAVPVHRELQHHRRDPAPRERVRHARRGAQEPARHAPRRGAHPTAPRR